MLVVSDTSPLTALLQVGRAELLPSLFDRIVIPPAVCMELLRDAVLLDERLGRRVARTLGLRVTGFLGILVLATQRGHLPLVAPIIGDLRTQAGCWFDDALVADVLRAAGEK